MNILMTGGTGFIGQKFIKKYDQHSFTVLTRKHRQNSLIPKVTYITSLNELKHLNQFDAIINLAGEPIIDKRWAKKQKEVIYNSRIETTRLLVDLFKKSDNPPAVFLSGSAIGIYGHRQEELLNEQSLINTNNFASKLCLDWEDEAAKASNLTRVVCLRTGIVLAKDKGAISKMLLPFKLGLGGKIGHGQQYMSWIHYQDYLRAMEHILKDNSLHGACNMVAPNPVSNKQFTHSLAIVLNRIAIMPMPALILKGLMGESSCLLLDSQKVKPSVLIEHKFRFKFNNLDECLNDLFN